MLHDETHGSTRNRRSPSRMEPRRYTIPPPAHTLRAKHLLAYLPRRPPADSVRYAPYPKKAASIKSTMVVLGPRGASPMSSLSASSYDNYPPLPLPLCAEASPSLRTQSVGHRSLQQDSTGQEETPPAAGGHYAVQAAVEEIPPKPPRSHRGRHLKRFSSRWVNGGGALGGIYANGSAENPSGGKPHKQRCKLLGGGDDRPAAHGGNQRQRYVTKDGKCRVNLGPIEDRSRFLSDIFTTLVDLKYRWFLFVFTMCYIVTWVAFAEVYFLDAWLRDDVAHVNDPTWRPCFQNVDSFLSALLLSVESQRTIGYGSRMVTAHCPEGVVFLMAQSIVGSIIDALMVGCMFVKISRPQKRAQTLIFSKHCVISDRDEKLCLSFRIGDLRASHMVDAKIRAKLIKSRQTKEGEFIPLEQSEINLGYDTGGDRLLLVEPQTITHVVSDTSPFWELGAAQLKREMFEIIIILEGIVEASGMTCQARTSYTVDEILWGHRFESCMSVDKGAFLVDYSAFNKTFEVQMSPLSAKERSAE